MSTDSVAGEFRIFSGGRGRIREKNLLLIEGKPAESGMADRKEISENW
jgi:hypothetical protein